MNFRRCLSRNVKFTLIIYGIRPTSTGLGGLVAKILSLSVHSSYSQLIVKRYVQTIKVTQTCLLYFTFKISNLKLLRVAGRITNNEANIQFIEIAIV